MAIQIFQTRSTSGTVIGASPDLRVTELDGTPAITHDFGILFVKLDGKERGHS